MREEKVVRVRRTLDHLHWGRCQANRQRDMVSLCTVVSQPCTKILSLCTVGVTIGLANSIRYQYLIIYNSYLY